MSQSGTLSGASTGAGVEMMGYRLSQHRGIAPGFDFLRIFLSVSVVAFHVLPVAMPEVDYRNVPLLWIYRFSILAAFFSLSGFLISGSAQRLSLKNFLINRGLRIIPALGVEVVISAVIIGAIFTTLPLGQYFTHPEFFAYFTNIVGIINWTLPGVFESHPSDIVNLTLWTVPHEIGCYVIISVFIVLGTMRYKPLIVISGALWVVMGFVVMGLGIERGDFGIIGSLLNVLFVEQASRLYTCFLFGIAAFLYIDKIPYSRIGALMCLAFLLAFGLYYRPGDPFDYPFISLIVTLPLVYLTMFLGVTNIWMPGFLRRGDYSYGIYLYGWPMQQVVVALAPGMGFVANFVLALIPITLFAMFSWHFIERPILSLRKKFSFVAKVRLAEG